MSFQGLACHHSPAAPIATPHRQRGCCQIVAALQHGFAAMDAQADSRDFHDWPPIGAGNSRKRFIKPPAV
jgi:hypothetical protein